MSEALGPAEIKNSGDQGTPAPSGVEAARQTLDRFRSLEHQAGAATWRYVAETLAPGNPDSIDNAAMEDFCLGDFDSMADRWATGMNSGALPRFATTSGHRGSGRGFVYYPSDAEVRPTDFEIAMPSSSPGAAPEDRRLQVVVRAEAFAGERATQLTTFGIEQVPRDVGPSANLLKAVELAQSEIDRAAASPAPEGVEGA